MKMNIKNLVILFASISFFSFTQITFEDIDINNINIFEKNTRQMIENKWGNADSYKSSISDTDGSGKDLELREVYKYGDNTIIFVNGVLSSFHFYDSRFTIFTKKNGGIKVGDTISKLKQLNIGKLILNSDGSYDWDIETLTDCIQVYHRNDVITKLAYIESI